METNGDAHTKHWDARKPQLKIERAQEKKGLLSFGLSLLTIIGGCIVLFYGLTGKDQVQLLYVIAASLSITLGMYIVLMGFGRMKKWGLRNTR